MKRTRTGVKICGITEEAGLDACIEYGADWIGFVFFERSPRYVSASRAAVLGKRVTNNIKKVGLFVNPDDTTLKQVLDQVELDILQVYTTPDRALQIQNQFGRPVWVSIPVAGKGDLPSQCPVQRILIEPKPPVDALHPGGNAQQLNWNLLQGWKPTYPWMLAGGLNPENVGQAVAITGVPAVDVSSGVESAPGIKNPRAIARFIHNARAPVIV
ncbi:phosphoribosylanthranilate isomerase [Acetobacter pomorum]|uniref:N-(5'-phosphoribosyl)anthranilate isomerase n=1 Tax=Acetobacter pomorum TaxID=65959 RepID=A0A2G4RBP4_9PROT|nr:phosphoribosylanthranilate isomerase [Acetobacter pomorum]PHY93999.1 phosphoribosylanthranilate isomerase [Acetobacter pomorum]GBR50472.1 phosphoribosyl anthranilate isomerase [Acetobacter pomorum DSM 11825]